MLKANGRLEINLVTSAGDRARVRVSRGGEERLVDLEDVRFATGGALTLVHSPEGNDGLAVA
jgi:hypothetical protein